MSEAPRGGPAAPAGAPAERRTTPRAGRRGVLLRVLIGVAALALLVFAARNVDAARVWAALRTASWPLLAAATLVNLASLALKGVRWWLFLRPIGARSLGLAMRATAAGAGLNNVLVANGGDAARVIAVARRTGLAASAVLASLALERVLDLLGYLVLLGAASLALPLPPGVRVWRWPALAIVLVATVALLVAGRRSAPLPVAALVVQATLPQPLLARLRGGLNRFLATAGALATPWRFAAAMALSVGAWLAQLLTFALVARAAGAPLPPAGDVAALLATNLTLLVRATPGNVGVFQLVYAATAVSFGAPAEGAIAAAVLIQLVQSVPVTLLGVAAGIGLADRPPDAR